MQQASLSSLAGFAAAPDRAASFCERGVAVPFTAPALLGVRIRMAGQGGLDFLLPNPSGARGLYVLPWEALAPLAQPSLHDTLLWRALRPAGPPTPRLIRAVARHLARGGAAGPLAQAAATAALAAEAAAQDAARSLLLARLTLSTEPAGTEPPLAADTPAGRERRAARALWALGTAQGIEAATMARRLNELAGLGAAHGPGGSVGRDIAALGGLLARLRERPGDPLAGAIAERVAEALALAHAACATLVPVLEQPVAVLAAWPARVAGVTETALRADWVLDGWGQLAALQGVVPPGHAMLAGLAGLVPAWPAEAASWSAAWGLGGRVAAPLQRPGGQTPGATPQAVLEAMLAAAA